jgi:hypothetical protein
MFVLSIYTQICPLSQILNSLIKQREIYNFDTSHFCISSGEHGEQRKYVPSEAKVVFLLPNGSQKPCDTRATDSNHEAFSLKHVLAACTV